MVLKLFCKICENTAFFAIFFRNFIANFRKFSGVRGASPRGPPTRPDPLHWSPRKFFLHAPLAKVMHFSQFSKKKIFGNFGKFSHNFFGNCVFRPNAQKLTPGIVKLWEAYTKIMDFLAIFLRKILKNFENFLKFS